MFLMTCAKPCPGAIQLALNVAGRSDKANLALSWIMDGRPEQVLYAPLHTPAYSRSPIYRTHAKTTSISASNVTI